jgi:hypothetical protein
MRASIQSLYRLNGFYAIKLAFIINMYTGDEYDDFIIFIIVF